MLLSSCGPDCSCVNIIECKLFIVWKYTRGFNCVTINSYTGFTHVLGLISVHVWGKADNRAGDLWDI